MTTGIDLVHIPDFENSMKEGGERFLNRIFTQSEQTNNKSETLAGIWAAKEAFFKATGSHLKPNQVEVRKDENGRPFLFLLEGEENKETLDISISHDHDYAIAICISHD